MDNWDDLRFLVAVAKSGSMTSAARLLGTNVATVSRRIDRLTQQLGTAPFVRTPEGWRPSTQVAGLIEVASAFEGHLATEVNSTQFPSSERQRVVVRLGAPPYISSRVLFPALVGTEGRLSAVRLEFGDRVVGEGLGEFDVIVRFGAPEAGRLRTKKVGSLSYRLYGSTSGPPSAEEWVGLSDLFDDSVPMQLGRSHFGCAPSVRASNFESVAQIMERTGLPGPLPDLVAREHAAVVPLRGDVPNPWVADFWVAYHESRRGDPAIEATVSWIEHAFARAMSGAAAAS